MRRMWRFCTVRAWAVLAVVVIASLCAAVAAAESDLERHLNDQYKGRTFILRGFYSGDHLEYDANGQAVNPRNPGDWTLTGVVNIEDLAVKDGQLRIDATRLRMGWLNGSLQELHDHAGKVDKSEKKDRSLRIKANLAATSPDAADHALAHIFLTSQDRFIDAVPNYWRPCVHAALTGEGELFKSCRFPQDFLTIPGVSSAEGQEAESSEKPDSPGNQTFRPGKGVTPPRAVSQDNPPFTDEARRAKYQGTTVLSVIVDKAGRPRNIKIVKPIGMGLDCQAVEVVSAWRFTPGTKGGEPVNVEIAVEVDFHLY